MNHQQECKHEWLPHAEKAFYCSKCGYFIETTEELQIVLENERNTVISEVEKILDAANVSDEIKKKIQELKKKS